MPTRADGTRLPRLKNPLVTDSRQSVTNAARFSPATPVLRAHYNRRPSRHASTRPDAPRRAGIRLASKAPGVFSVREHR